MANNWYATLEAVKRAVNLYGSERDSVISSCIEAASREVDNLTGRRFIPKTETRRYRWPQREQRNAYILYFDQDLLSVSAFTKDGDDATAIPAADYFLEPSNLGPPYSRIEIDLASTSFFSAKDTHQRALRVTGDWGYGNDTKAAGALAEADDGSETALDVTDASLIDVGDTILIGTEQMFVSAKAALDTTANLNGDLTADATVVSVTVTDGTKVKQGETVKLDSELMYVSSISGAVLTVIRAYDGSVLAAHTGAVDVYAFRTLTVTRSENGTTAASHATAATISKYAPPADIVNLCKALSIAYYHAGQGGWTGEIGSGEGAVEGRMAALGKLRESVRREYRKIAVGAV